MQVMQVMHQIQSLGLFLYFRCGITSVQIEEKDVLIQIFLKQEGVPFGIMSYR